MNVRQIIAADYKEYISLHKHLYPTSLIDGLKAQERMPAFLDKMAHELTLAERRKTIRLDRVKIKNTVYEMTRFFLNNLKRQADEMALSDSERSRVVQSATASQPISDECAAEYEKELVADKVVISDDRTKSL